MPFEGGARSFTHVSIQNNAPKAAGIYGLCNSREWLLIGEATDIRASLFEHLRESAASPSNRKPTGFMFELCLATDRRRRRETLVRELRPVLQHSLP